MTCVFFLVIRLPPRSTRTDTLFPYTTLFRSSGFDAKAVSSKGAQGVMQLMPGVATEYGVEDPFEPAQSISAGARYMMALLRRYHGDRTLAAAAYNAGIGTVARYGGVPPYDETRT